MNIIAIGGAEMAQRETLAIDRLIVDLTGKSLPKALLIPTASGDAERYRDSFAGHYGKLLGCATDNLLLLGEDQNRERIREKILNADLIYVGGGYTPRMLKVWRKLGVDELLKAAHRQGTVLAGTSAGAICWHQWGHSNTRSDSSRLDRRFQRLKGLSLCPGLFCPHAGEPDRYRSFVDVVQRHGGLGIACDQGAAVHYSADHQPRVVAVDSAARVSLHRREGEQVHCQTYRSGDTLPLPGS